ncbi:MAG: SSS family solute:Na+ symporter [Planctomycetota bacterium]|jgi:SSS family solute:Na+ symporter
MESTFLPLDYIILVGYFLLIFGVAFWTSIKEKSTANTENYFLGGKNIGWFVIGASLFASNIGSEHLVGLAGQGASSGIAAAQFEILAVFMLLILGWVFVPFYLKSGVFTMPEFLEKRYNAGARYYLSIISIVAYVLTKISVTIFAGAVIFEALLGIDFWTGAFIIVIATGIYTVFGGLRAVVYTDLVQMFILLGGAIAVTAIGLHKVGGWNVMYETVNPGMMSLWKPASDPNYPWTGILFGAPILGIWYWCTDQFIVQRVLSSKDISNARRSTIFAGFLKLTPLFLFLLPGVLAFVLAKQGQIVLENPDYALGVMINSLLPTGLKGLVAAGLLAALMSSLSSVFNSCSTLFTLDLYQKFVPGKEDKHYVRIGQLATVVLVLLGLAWIPFVNTIGNSGLFKSLQSIQAYISPPIAAVFLFGLLSKKVNGKGAIAALAIGGILGAIRLVLEVLYPEGAGLSGVLFSYVTINFLYMAIILFVISTIVLFAVSISSGESNSEEANKLTFTYGETNWSEITKSKEFILSMILVVCVFIIWIYFR